MTVGRLNIPRRGNQPSANSCDRSIEVKKFTASKISERTMPALIRTDRPAVAKRTALTRRSFLRRCGDPRRRRRRESWRSWDDVQSTAYRIGNRPDRPSWSGRFRGEEDGLLARVPGGPRLRELVCRQVHVGDGLEDGRDRALREVVVDVRRHGRVGSGLRLVDVDVQGPRQGIRGVGDRLGARRDARPVRVLGDLDLGDLVLVLLGECEPDPAERGRRSR